MTTKVIFRYSPKLDEVFALFPYDMFNSGLVASYFNDDKRPAMNYTKTMRTSKPATPEQYSELKAELEGLGHELKVISKAGPAYMVISPDGFPISREGQYSSIKEAEKDLREWIEQYRKKGFYSSNEGKIDVKLLADYCYLKRVR